MARMPSMPPFKMPELRSPGVDLEPLKTRLRTDPRAERIENWGHATAVVLSEQLRAEWAGSPPHRWLIARPAPQGRAAAPIDLRPPRVRRGKAILAGRFTFDGLVLEPGLGVEPWDLPSPSRPFAVALHGMAWLPDLLAVENGPRVALSLVLGWEQVFGRWNSFSWSPPVLERRVFNLACALKTLSEEALEADAALLAASLARQTRHLLLGDGEPVRASEQACAAAVAGCALGGRAGEQLRTRALRRLEQTLPVTVLADGGHASRSPEAAMELLLDLRTLDEALSQLGRVAPIPLTRAIDRLIGALRFFTLADGKLPAMQGGEAGDPERIVAARAPDDTEAQGSLSAPHSGYEKLHGRALQAIMDVGAPAPGPWSRTACAQPLAIEVLAGKDRLIVNTGWSARAATAQALRLTPAASAANVADTSAGYPLGGTLARILGNRLAGAVRRVDGRRHEGEGGAWLEYSHDGWAHDFGLIHERRLYLDFAADELRGEDALWALQAPFAPRSRRPPFLVVRFQLHAEVKASLVADQRSVLLQGPTSGGWWLRNDAPEVRLEPGVHLIEGRPQASHQIVLRTLVRRDGSARIRWKLSATED